MAGKSAALRVIPEDDGGLTLEDLFADTVTIEVVVSGRRLEVTWSPAKFTPVLEERAMALTAAPAEDEDEDDITPIEREKRVAQRLREENTAIREFLANVVVAWSLKSRDGTPVATDEETLRSLPAPFLRTVFATMTANAGPKDATEPPSGRSS